MTLNLGSAEPEQAAGHRRFSSVYAAGYPELVMVLRALGGSDTVARRLVDDTFVQAWLKWRQVRDLPEPLTWARWTAVRTFTRTATSATAVDEEPATEAGVLIKALAKLPGPQRRAVVLHYMAEVPVNELARFAGRRAEHIEVLLDDGFDALVELFDWPKLRSDEKSTDSRYYWTAEMLSEVGKSLAEAAVAPAAGRVIRRAELQRWKGRAVPVMGAAAGVAAILVAPLLLQQPASLGSTLPESSYMYVDPPDSTPGSGARVPARKPLPAAPATAVFGAAVQTDIDPAAAGPTFVPALASAPPPSADPAWQGPVAVAATDGSAAAAAGPAAVAVVPVAAGGTASAGGSGAGAVPAAETTPTGTTPPATSTSPPATSTTPPPVTTPLPPTTTTPPVTTEPPPTTTEPPTTTTTEPPTTTTTEPPTTEPPTTTTTSPEQTTSETTTTEETSTTTTTTTTELTTTAEETSTTAPDDE